MEMSYGDIIWRCYMEILYGDIIWRDCYKGVKAKWVSSDKYNKDNNEKHRSSKPELKTFVIIDNMAYRLGPRDERADFRALGLTVVHPCIRAGCIVV